MEYRMAGKPHFADEDPLGQAAQAVLIHVQTHGVKDKDKARAVSTPRPSKTKIEKTHKGRTPAQWNDPIPDAQIDLHGLSTAEALAKIEEWLDTAERHGLQVLRVVHGGGHGDHGYGPIKKYLYTQFRSVWKHRIANFGLEKDNPGSTLIRIAPRKENLESRGKKR